MNKIRYIGGICLFLSFACGQAFGATEQSDSKASRTALEKKIDCHLLEARKKVALRKSQGASADDTLVAVRISCSDVVAISNVVLRLGGQVIDAYERYRCVNARIPVETVESLAAEPGVTHVRTMPRGRPNKVNTSEGVSAHLVDEVRSTYGLTGKGVKVGVLSDSVDYLDDVQWTGDLPDVEVLDDYWGDGEGTAMLEIVHDMAPDAELYFATADRSEESFAENIRALADAGCKVIVDDYTYLDEPAFQDGIIAQAVADVTARGCLFFSSAANSGSLKMGTSGTFEGDFKDTDGDGYMNFPDGKNYIELSQCAHWRITLQWSDPWGASSNDYDLEIEWPDGTTSCGNDTQDGDDNPYEVIRGCCDGECNGAKIKVKKRSGADRYIRIDTHRGQLSGGTSGNTYGHNACEAAITLGAASARENARPFTTRAVMEDYSSDGPRHMFYAANGSPLTPGNLLASGGRILQKPEVVAADDVSCATYGFNPFGGTSASAPHAAAIAALMLEKKSNLTKEQLLEAWTSTSWRIDGSTWNACSGHGIINAKAAVEYMIANFDDDPVPPPVDGILYTIVDSRYASVTGYVGTATSLTIPETLGGYPVEVIGGTAFMDNWTLTEVVLPSTCNAVNSWAFCNCMNLRKVTFGFHDDDEENNVVYIYDDSFEECPNLTVNVDSDVAIVPWEMFLMVMEGVPPSEYGRAVTVDFIRKGYNGSPRWFCERWGEGEELTVTEAGWWPENGFAWSYWTDDPVPPSGGKYYAQFTGINEYQNSSGGFLRTLYGCVDDADLMWEACVEYGNWVEGDSWGGIWYLSDDYATEEHIRDTVHELADLAVAGDTVFLYHSSHGSATGVATYDSEYDYSTGGATEYDKWEMAEDLGRFRSGVKVVVIVDACESGGLFNAAKGKVTSLGEEVRNIMREKQREKGPSASNNISADEIGWITAADAYHSSYDSTFTPMIYDGWTSWDADANADGKINFYELYDYAKYAAWDDGTIAQCCNEDVLETTWARGGGSDHNDDFADAIELQGESGVAYGSNVGATTEAGEPDHAGCGSTKTVWWTWTPGRSGTATFTTEGSNFDTVLAVYTGATLGSLVEVDSNDDAEFPYEVGQNVSAVSFPVLAGRTYHIAVGGYKDNEGAITLSWDTFNPPANDDFVDAIRLQGASGKVSGTNIGATREVDEPTEFYRSVWWTWTPTKSGEVTFSTKGSDFNAEFIVFVGDSLESLEEVEWTDEQRDDDDWRFGGSFMAVAGTTYHIAVGGYSIVAGAIALSWTTEDGSARPGKWTSDVDAVKEAAQKDGRMIAIEWGNLAGCGWCQALEPHITDDEFLSWAEENGVYLVCADDSKFDDVAAARTWFSSCYEGGMIEFPTIVFVDASDLETCLGQGLFRYGETVGDIQYEDSVESLIECFEQFLPDPPPPPDVDTKGTVVLGRDGAAVTSKTFYLGDAMCKVDVTQLPEWITCEELKINGSTWQVSIPISTPIDTLSARVSATENTTGNDRPFDWKFRDDAGNVVFTLTILQLSGSEPQVQVQAPVLDPESQAFEGEEFTVNCTCADAEAEIHYTIGETEPADPTEEDALWPADGLLITEESIVKVRAFLTGRKPSDVVTGDYTCHSCEPTDSNDDFANADEITGRKGSTTCSSVGATLEKGEPRHYAGCSDATVWWKWTAPSDGPMTVDTMGSSFDTVMAVYTGTDVSHLDRVDNNDDVEGDDIVDDETWSRIAFDAEEGETYHIVVAGNGYAEVGEGEVKLNWAFGGEDPIPVEEFYTIRFESGDEEATGEMDELTATVGKFIKLPQNKFELPGKYFDGWYCEETEKKYGDAFEVLDLAEAGQTATLVARWTKKPAIYEITFASGEGDDAEKTDPVSVGVGMTYWLAECPFKAEEGQTFTGWLCLETGEIYEDRQEIHDLAKQGGTVTLVAQWEGQVKVGSYTIVFAPGTGGSGTMAPMQVQTNATVKLTKCAFVNKNPAVTFAQWKSDAGKTYRDEQEVRDLAKAGETVTLTAQWGCAPFPQVDDGFLDDEKKDVQIGFAAYVYDGYLLATNEDSSIAGTVTVKVDKNGKTTATVTRIGVKKLSYKSQMPIAKGEVDLVCTKDSAPMHLTVYAGAIEGSCGAYQVKCHKNVAKENPAGYMAVEGKVWAIALKADEQNATDTMRGYASLTVTGAKKGKVKVSGLLPDGTKVSASVQAVVRPDGRVEIPVVVQLYSGKVGGISLALQVDGKTGEAEVCGVGKWKSLSGDISWDSSQSDWASVNVSGISRNNDMFVLEEQPELIGGMNVATQFLHSVSNMMFMGKKWMIAKGGKIKLMGAELVDQAASPNPGGLTLSYTPKTGAFKGKYAVYANNFGKAKKLSATINGVIIGAAGYGTAVIKKTRSIPVRVEEQKK